MNAFLLIATIATSQSGTVSKVETSKVFAGKLGYRVTTQLTVEVNGKSQLIKVSPYHTVPSHNYKFKVGQKLNLRSKTSGTVNLSDIR